jgi:uncharacterized repeat protein (TIGR02059 family)
MKTKLAVIFLSLSISLMRKCLLVILVFPFLMQMSCSKDYTFETTETATIGNTSTLGTATGTTYYVSPTGNDGAAGTLTAPWLTWQKAFNTAVAGDIVYFRGGIYYVSGTVSIPNSGTVGNPICYFNYPNEKPILDGINKVSPSTGIFIDTKNYLHFKGLTVRNNLQITTNYYYAINFYFYQCTEIIIENCTSYNSGHRGFDIYECHGNILIKNCDSYNNCDNLTTGYAGGGGDGFQVHDNNSADDVNTYVTLRGCRSWHNSDDGFDVINEGYTVIDSCWTWNNGYLSGEGNGIKYGWQDISRTGLSRRVTNCLSAYNTANGFDEANRNYLCMDVEVYNNTSYHNYAPYVTYSLHSGPNKNNIYRNNIAYNNTVWDWGGYYVHDHNSWDLSVTVSAADFVSLDSTGISGARQANGSLPGLDFLKLASNSDLIDKGIDEGLTYTGSAPDLGWFESSYGSGSPATPVYASSSIANATPSILEMTYNSTLANIVPVASAFTVQVNSAARTVSSVSISGTKVLLTLASPVVYGNAVTVAYTKPASNPIQTSSGGLAASITARSVTNNVAAAVLIPVYISSSVTNATPAVLEIIYNSTLASIVPAASAFSVMVNSATRTVSSISISGTKVMLTIASPVVNGNVVTVSYIKPATNPIQTSSGGQAASFTAQSVTNNVAAAVLIPVYTSSSVANATPSVLEMTYNSSLANIVPATSAFTVMVNSAARIVSSISISGTKVSLTLASPVVYGNTVTVAYTKPATNPIQTSSGGQAASISTQSVVNNCTPSTNQPPVISISSPVNGSSFRSPATITITANASDINGTISKVEFFNGSIKLGERTTTPYSFVWKNVPRGTYSITAMATDNLNSKTVSIPVSVTVRRRIY